MCKWCSDEKSSQELSQIIYIKINRSRDTFTEEWISNHKECYDLQKSVAMSSVQDKYVEEEKEEYSISRQ
jgi:hypothetical protein